MTQPPVVQPKRSGFGRAFLYFLLGVLVLVGISSGIGYFLEGGEGKLGKDSIGLVEVTGFIGDSREVNRQIRSFREDDHIRGIIVRIDSPGGAVAPSQEIYQEVLKTRKSGKPIFASMGSVAASGGYYIAAAADRIYANPGTLTGSIGVIMAFTNASGLMDKIGLKPEVIKAGKFKDSGSPARSMTKEERRYLQNVVGDVHKQFIDAVASARKMDKKQAGQLADGRIFTGRQAHELNMVDALGGLEDAIENMGAKLGIDGRPNVIQESRQTTFLEWFMSNKVPDNLKPSLMPDSLPSLQYLWLP